MVSQARQVAGFSLRNTITGSIVKRITHSLAARSCVQNEHVHRVQGSFGSAWMGGEGFRISGAPRALATRSPGGDRNHPDNRRAGCRAAAFSPGFAAGSAAVTGRDFFTSEETAERDGGVFASGGETAAAGSGASPCDVLQPTSNGSTRIVTKSHRRPIPPLSLMARPKGSTSAGSPPPLVPGGQALLCYHASRHNYRVGRV